MSIRPGSYLTSNPELWVIPIAEIKASVAEFQQKRRDELTPPVILALSWRHISEVFRGSGNLILSDLVALAKRFGFLYFHGFHVSSEHKRQTWRFNDEK